MYLTQKPSRNGRISADLAIVLGLWIWRWMGQESQLVMTILDAALELSEERN